MSTILSDSWEAFAADAAKYGAEPELLRELRNAFYSGCHFIMIKLSTSPEELQGIAEELSTFHEELIEQLERKN